MKPGVHEMRQTAAKLPHDTQKTCAAILNICCSPIYNLRHPNKNCIHTRRHESTDKCHSLTGLK